jgi:hypothetical protein
METLEGKYPSQFFRILGAKDEFWLWGRDGQAQAKALIRWERGIRPFSDCEALRQFFERASACESDSDVHEGHESAFISLGSF